MAESKIPNSAIDDGTSGWVILNSTIKYKRDGKIVSVSGTSSGVTPLTVNTWNSLGTLPSECRPSTEILFVGMERTNARAILCRIEENGAISAFPEVSNTNLWYFLATYTL